MKKQVIILLLIIFHLSAWSQKSFPTDGPCTKAMAEKAKGRWIKTTDNLFTTTQQAEVFKRLDAIHQLVLKIYPEPIGVDAVWHRTNRNQFFASQQKIDYNRDGVPRRNEINGIPVATYYYNAGFFPYFCNGGKNEMYQGWPGETGTVISVYINSLDFYGRGKVDDPMTIDGRPVGMRPSVKKTWKGYELSYGDEVSENKNAFGGNRSVLIHREGMLPYIPVTRKQYLDHSIEHLNEIFDKIIKEMKEIPVRSLEEQETEKKNKLAKFEKDFGKDPKRLKSAVDYYLSGYQTDQQRRDEQVKAQVKNKEDVLKHYQDELEKTTKEGLLDSPAIVRLFHSPDAQTPVFVKETEGGSMLITENPAYIKKDLPKHVPQFMVFFWSWNANPPEKKIGEIVEANFPIDKLQAMIDK